MTVTAPWFIQSFGVNLFAPFPWSIKYQVKKKITLNLGIQISLPDRKQYSRTTESQREQILFITAASPSLQCHYYYYSGIFVCLLYGDNSRHFIKPANSYNILELGRKGCVSSYNDLLNNPAIPRIFNLFPHCQFIYHEFRIYCYSIP